MNPQNVLAPTKEFYSWSDRRIFLLVQPTYFFLNRPVSLVSVGTIIYLWFQQQCTEVECKEEYDRSCQLLKGFLCEEETKKHLTQKCIRAVLALQEKLRAKEAKLANYMRMDSRNCLDACTTSPVESANNAIKHGPNKVSSNMNLDRSTERMISGVNRRLDKRRNQAFRDMNLRNQSSCAPTRDFIIPHGQRLIDRFYDLRHHCKSAQVEPGVWRVWDFDEWLEDVEANKFKAKVWAHMPVFCRVWELRVNNFNGRTFIKCSCKKRTKIGVPCRCFARVIDNGSVLPSEMLDIGMIDIRYWKIFNAHYGSDTEIGRSLLEAQKQCFFYEHAGIAVNANVVDKIVGDEKAEYPILGPNTTMTDYEEMNYVWKRPGTTLVELEMNRACMLDDSDYDDLTLNGLRDESRKNKRIAITKIASSMQERIDETEDRERIMTEKEQGNFMSTIIARAKTVSECELGDMELKNEFLLEVERAYDRYIDKRNKSVGTSGGGDGKLMLAGHTKRNNNNEGRRRGVV